MSRMGFRCACLLGGVSAAAVICGQAQAQNYSFDIPAQPLSASLREYAHVSGQQIIFTNDLVAGYTGRPLHGSYNPDEALSQLLSGTGLVVERSPSGVLMICRERHAALDTPTLVNTVSPAPREVTADPPPEPAGVEQMVVTGTRILNGNNLPTPVTVMTAQNLQTIAPLSVPDALNTLPEFTSFDTPNNRSDANGKGVGQGNYLNLRGMGPIRTLILQDGNCVPGTSFDTTVDVDMLPQMLIQRVDVVKGGVSAVYGSDACHWCGELYHRQSLQWHQGSLSGR